MLIIFYNNQEYIFKDIERGENKKEGKAYIKGKSKVRTLAAVDVELIKKMDELVDYVLTDNRLNQGLDVLKANGIDVDDNKNTKEFIDWIRKDVFKEEQDTILKSGLDVGKVMGKICSKAGKFFATR